MPYRTQGFGIRPKNEYGFGPKIKTFSRKFGIGPYWTTGMEQGLIEKIKSGIRPNGKLKVWN